MVPISSTPVGAIGWTQNSINRQVYNVTEGNFVEIRTVVNAAMEDPRGPLAFMREHFPEPIRVFDSGASGILSIDNRRLAIYRMVVSSDTLIPVRVLTQEQAGQALLRDQRRNPEDAQAASAALLSRCSTRNGGYSVLIRGTGLTISQAECYVNSPFVLTEVTAM